MSLSTGRPGSDVISAEESERCNAPVSPGGLRRARRQPGRGGPPGLVPRVGPAPDHQEGPREEGLPLRPPLTPRQRSQRLARQSEIHLQDEVHGK